MLRLLTTLGTFLSLFVFTTPERPTRGSTDRAGSEAWRQAVKAHGRFDNWT